jgi:hypothetical protein
MRVVFLSIHCALFLLAFCGTAGAQSETSPVKIGINRVVFNPGNRYAIYLPSFEFHALFQQTTGMLRSTISADYDYRRQDMGFGMSHAFYRYIINPGIVVEDNLYFRKVFNDSTGIWNRNQTITPFLVHQLNRNSVVGMEFHFERESSPKIKEGSSIINYQDRSMKVYYLYQTPFVDPWNHSIQYVSLARSYKIMNGSFNYLVAELLSQYSMEMNRYVRYKGIFSYRGNLTPQSSPLFFIGGLTSLIGFEKDEFWGRRAMYSQNLFELKPFPDLKFSLWKSDFRRLSLLFQFDLGKVVGAPDILQFKHQTSDVKSGIGVGVGFNTDLPYMDKTDVHLLIASPSDNPSNLKFYAGFGGWVN